MFILCLDTATAIVVVGLARVDGAAATIVSQRRGAGPARHAEVLAPAVLEVLTEAGVAPGELAAVIVGIGPGPFTGLRIGMVSAAAFGDALGIPVHGVCSLDAIAADLPVSSLPVLVATDARRREIYWAVYADGRRSTGPTVDTPADVAARLPGWGVAHAVGDGAVRYADSLGVPVSAAAPTAAGLLAAADLSQPPPPALVPLYLRRPDAVVPAARIPGGPR